MEKLKPLQPRAAYESVTGSFLHHNVEQFLKQVQAGTDPFQLRQEYISEYGFVLLTQETHAALVALLKGKKVLDAGAGSGYMAQALTQAGIDTIAADIDVGDYGFRRRWQRDIEADAVTLLPGDFGAVLLSWPNLNTDFGVKVARAMAPGQLLVYQGEGWGGCTANDAFFEEIRSKRWAELEEFSQSLNQGHVQFMGMHDYWHVYKRI